MNREDLVTKREVVEEQFNANQEELNRLQGEYRAYTKLIDEIDAKELSPTPTEGGSTDDPAKTIEVKTEDDATDATTDQPE